MSEVSKELVQATATGVFVIPITESGAIGMIRSDSKENGFKAENVVAGSEVFEVVDPHPGHADFQFPGGGKETDETVGDTANREFWEEVLVAVFTSYAQQQGKTVDELSQNEKTRLEVEFSRVFKEINGVMQEVESVLVQQFLVDEQTGARTLRDIFDLVMVAIELSKEQQQFLQEYEAITTLQTANSNGATIRPYVKTLMELGVIEQFVGEL